MDTTTLAHSFTGPGGTLRWTLTGPSLDADDWGTHSLHVLVFPSPEARNDYRDNLPEHGTPIGRFALLWDGDSITRDDAGRVASVTFDPWGLSTTENGWYDGTARGETCLADADRLTPSAASRPGALAEWLTAHGIPTEYVGEATA